MHSGELDETPLDRRDREANLGTLIPGVLLLTLALGSAIMARPVALSSGLVLPVLVGVFGLVLAAGGVYGSERRRRRLVDRVDALTATTRTLHERARRKDEFLASVSHELRTPLNVILGYVDLLLDDSFGRLEVPQRDVLHRLTKNASNLSHLINDLVDLSRIEANRLRIEMESVQLAPLFADLGAVADVLLTGRDVAFRSTIAPGCDRVYADPNRLKQILSNLLVNAVKFTDRGCIELSAKPYGRDSIEIRVTDTGIGIPPNQHRAIFEPFRQVHDRARRVHGVGLGLSIAARLAALMHGSLCLESTPGHGSRFSLTLRTVNADASSSAVPLRRVS